MIWNNAYKLDNTTLDDYEGFVYCITEFKTGKKYYGIKKFWKIVKYPPLKGKKNKRHFKRPSDWKTYTTSSPIMQQKLADHRADYDCIILELCKTVTEMKAKEAYYQLEHYMRGDWNLLYNEVINLRLRIR